jgi:hypothetical protein
MRWETIAAFPALAAQCRGVSPRALRAPRRCWALLQITVALIIRGSSAPPSPPDDDDRRRRDDVEDRVQPVVQVVMIHSMP